MKKWRVISLAIIVSAMCVATHNNVIAQDNLSGNLYIVAVNPGYSTNNIGELVELKKLSDTSLSLAGVSLLYINSEGDEYALYEFDEGDEMTGESLLMRYKKAGDVEERNYDLLYSTKSLIQGSGILQLRKDGEKFDEICWGNIDGCGNRKFKSASNETLVHDIDNIGTEDEFTYPTDYVPTFDPENPSFYSKEEEVVEATPQCRNLRFSEILTYYETNKSEQFIEFFNDGDEQIVADGCSIKYKNKFYALSGMVTAYGYLTRHTEDFTLTKNPASENKIELVDTDGKVVDTLKYYNGQKKGVSYAQFGYDGNGKEQWMQTYQPTENAENVYQKWKICPAGKVINEETGNCVSETTKDTTLEACPAGKYRNPLTNRCKSYSADLTSGELKPCAEGYERNPETNRCRKIKTNTGAAYALEENTFEEKSSFIATIAIICVLAAGGIYIIYQYREEIGKVFRKKK